MSAPAAIDLDAYSRAAGSSLFVDPSENESGVVFNVAIIYVLPIDSPADVNVQYAAVKGADPSSPELEFEGGYGYRGNGTTLRIGALLGVGVSIKSPSSCLIGRLNVGMMYSGIMLFGIETSGGDSKG